MQDKSNKPEAEMQNMNADAMADQIQTRLQRVQDWVSESQAPDQEQDTEPLRVELLSVLNEYIKKFSRDEPDEAGLMVRYWFFFFDCNYEDNHTEYQQAINVFLSVLADPANGIAQKLQQAMRSFRFNPFLEMVKNTADVLAWFGETETNRAEMLKAKYDGAIVPDQVVDVKKLIQRYRALLTIDE